MKHSISCAITTAILLCQNAFASNLPAYVTVCNRDSPTLSQCFKENLQNLGPHLANGISEFEIPPVSKFVIPEIGSNHINTSSANVNVTLRNIKFGGLETYSVVDAKISLQEEPFLSYQLHFEELFLICVSKAKGKVLVMSFDGEADVISKNKDARITCEWVGERYSRGEKEHLKFKIRNQSSVVSYIEPDIRGFFKQKPELDDAFNQMLKDNADAVRSDLQPFLAEAVCGVFSTFQNRVFSMFDLEQLFPSK